MGFFCNFYPEKSQPDSAQLVFSHFLWIRKPPFFHMWEFLQKTTDWNLTSEQKDFLNCERKFLSFFIQISLRYTTFLKMSNVWCNVTISDHKLLWQWSTPFLPRQNRMLHLQCHNLKNVKKYHTLWPDTETDLGHYLRKMPKYTHC